MLTEPYREVAAAILVGTCGRLLFQQRDDIPGLLYAGLVGLFGGHREGAESAVECVQRELAEEIGLTIAPARLEPLVRIQCGYPLGGGLKGEFFLVRDIPIDGLVVTEGRPLVATLAEVPALLARMTPSTCYVARVFLETLRPQR